MRTGTSIGALLTPLQLRHLLRCGHNVVRFWQRKKIISQMTIMWFLCISHSSRLWVAGRDASRRRLQRGARAQVNADGRARTHSFAKQTLRRFRETCKPGHFRLHIWEMQELNSAISSNPQLWTPVSYLWLFLWHLGCISCVFSK